MAAASLGSLAIYIIYMKDVARAYYVLRGALRQSHYEDYVIYDNKNIHG